MLNTPWHNRTIPYAIKRTTRMPISEMRKTCKAVLGAKTQVTSLSFLAGLMVVLMLGTPFLSVAQQRNRRVDRIIIPAERKATAQTNRFAWFALGFIGGPITVAVTAFQKPPPPAELLTGKSVGYIETYTEAYTAKAKSIRLRYATIGCFTGTALGFLGYTAYDYQTYGNWWWETW